MYLPTKEQAEVFKQDIRQNIYKISGYTVAIVLASDDEASRKYVNSKIKLLNEFGIKYIFYDIEPKYETVYNLVDSLAKDDNINAIMLELPLGNNIDSSDVIELIPYYKDVDGITNHNIGRLFKNQKGVLPCTVKAVKKILEYNSIDVSGKNVAVVGRSLIAGKPLSVFFTNNNATVTLCHTKTTNTKDILRGSDIVAVAVGKKQFFGSEYFKKDAVIIDIGTNYCEGRVYGDVGDVSTPYNKVTPVPSGVGLFTALSMIDNLIDIASLSKNN